MVIFPAVSALISLICAGVMARDAIVKPRPDKVAWAVAFAIFAVAAGSEVLASLTEWSATLARVYYLTGAVLVVGYLALGELYLLAGQRIHKFAPGVTLLVTAIATTVVFEATVDGARLAADGWEALERGAALKALAIGINAGGTVVIVGGLIYSAWRFQRLGIQRNRMIGCLLIALGTLTVAMGGTLTRLGRHEYLYIAMSIGVAIIFAGVLQTRRTTKTGPTADRQRPTGVWSAETTPATNGYAAGYAKNGHSVAATTQVDPAIAFIESRLRALDADALSEECRVWSVSRVEADAFDRVTARAAWALRTRLSAEAQERFDALPVAVRAQLTELHDEVLSARPSAMPLER